MKNLKEYLDELVTHYNQPKFIKDDPISLPHQFVKLQDIEIIGFWVAMIAWGRRQNIINSGERLIELMDGAPYDFIINHKEKDRKRFLDFKKKIQFLSKKLNHVIKNITKEKKIIHVCGASTKGNIILQYSKINKKDVGYAADRNPLKWNRKMPGSNIPIVSEHDSRSKKPNFYLVLPWHFKKEFIMREKK